MKSTTGELLIKSVKTIGKLFSIEEIVRNNNLSVDGFKNGWVSSKKLNSMCGLRPERIYGGLYHVHNDHLATPQVITDYSKAIVWNADYTPFGEATTTVSTITNNLRFPGQYYDQETGKHYNYFRDYDPSIGRYMQSDPIGLLGGINTYAYVEQNPVKHIDPTGLAPSLNPVERNVMANAARGNWDEVVHTIRHAGGFSEKQVNDLIRRCASKRGNELVKQFKKEGVGTGARSGQHGTPFKRAAEALKREANKQSDPGVKEALKRQAERMRQKGRATNHR